MSMVWVGWLIFFAASFAGFEAYALKYDKPTLSRTVWNASKAWPPLGVVFGIFMGGLAVHFFWPGQGCGL